MTYNEAIQVVNELCESYFNEWIKSVKWHGDNSYRTKALHVYWATQIEAICIMKMDGEKMKSTYKEALAVVDKMENAFYIKWRDDIKHFGENSREANISYNKWLVVIDVLVKLEAYEGKHLGK